MARVMNVSFKVQSKGGIVAQNANLRARQNHAAAAPQIYSAAMNFRQTGDGTFTFSPVGVSWPVLASTWNVTIVSLNWFSTKRKLPVGSSVKCRGSFPPVGRPPIGVSVPFFTSTAKIAMLSLPRLETYRNLPLGWMATSATSLRPLKSEGTVETLLTCFSSPFLGSYEKLAAVELSSLTTNRNLPFGENMA